MKYNTYKATFVALSPIHIGTGEQINNWNYAIDNRKIAFYNFDKVVYYLRNDKNKLLNFKSIIEKNPLNYCLGDAIKSFNINVNPDYVIPYYGKIKKHKDEYKEIWEFIKENGKVYIPGSEIKGAIRTALFYKILKDTFKADKEEENKFINEYKNIANYVKNRNCDKNLKKEISGKTKNLIQKLENKVFMRPNHKGQFDAKTDFMKNLMISDSSLKNPEEVLSVKDIKVIGISKNKNMEELYEVVNRGSQFEIKINIFQDESFKKIFNKNYEKYLNLQSIINATNEFSERLLEEEITYFEKSKELDFDSKRKIIDSLKKILDLTKTRKYIILRIGKHEGFLSTTVNLLIKDLAPDSYSKIYPCLVNRGYKNLPNKSRKITAENEVLGWGVLVLE
ncbi:MAG: type III-A CRISPR-associated RAMP protein Csm5 [Hydrogenothermus sp.]|nr:MAG: type III-A CRISPR-associated RAMP protein Csm5 [Hydrogenothermus sp.]